MPILDRVGSAAPFKLSSTHRSGFWWIAVTQLSNVMRNRPRESGVMGCDVTMHFWSAPVPRVGDVVEHDADVGGSRYGPGRCSATCLSTP